jgi:hypothetical protein
MGKLFNSRRGAEEKIMEYYHADRYEDGTPLQLGDIVETNPPECRDEWKRGRVIKIFGPTPTHESLEWHLKPGQWHIIIERDDGEFEGFFELDEHIRFVSRGRDNGQN